MHGLSYLFIFNFPTTVSEEYCDRADFRFFVFISVLRSLEIVSLLIIDEYM